MSGSRMMPFMNYAQAIAASIRYNSQRYHENRITHAEFTRTSQALWAQAERLGVDYDVAAILWGRT